MKLTVFLLLALAALGATSEPQRGSVWPKPQSTVRFHNNGFVIVSINTFRFNVTLNKCDILSAALTRYYKYLSLEREAGYSERVNFRAGSNEVPLGEQPLSSNSSYRGRIDSLEVELMARCEDTPYFGMDEHYELRVDSPDVPLGAKLVAHSIWGILRGLETFVQLAAPSADGTALHMSSCMISDYPRFPHRGLLVDTARHFMPIETLHKIIDGMEASKLNTFHWHIVDDQSFPYQSKLYPELSDKGAYNPLSHVYTQNDVKALIEYCRLRGIRVIPEFDTPGHTLSWGNSHPELLTKCYNSKSPLGPMDPTKKSTYRFIQNFFSEIAEVFPDRYFHVGGDEVSKECWKSNPDINNWMRENNISGLYNKLESFYINKAVHLIYSLNMSTIVWQEVFDNGDTQLDKNTVVHIWKLGSFMEELRKTTSAGYMTLLSSCWYLDHLKSGGDWTEMYQCDPHNFDGTEEQKRLILGGEACMWSEFVDFTNVVPRVFPRASAVAERLWSDRSVKDIPDATQRLDEFRCRLLRRGVHAQPSRGPGYCPGEIF
ncbi:Hypothetical predicted protein [Cloeon dipterum]|uniref:Beta-hexosaminidase n=1 Tax=Cloeon dipterum TaxID=197152 RepID=A0A8S1CHU5_9INSE|nr:Hypothetical predicted protein [Cloeon dipterum]